MNHRITKKCGMCGEICSVELNQESFEAYQEYCKGIGYIQDIPVADRPTEKQRKVVREFLKMGTCQKCQKLLFG